MDRDFDAWMNEFRPNIAGYKYYVDFEKVYNHVDKIKVELNILNSLIGSKQIEADFKSLYAAYPQILRCIPILLAKREKEIPITEPRGYFRFNFKEMNYSLADYVLFMRETGLFKLLQERKINNLMDYVTGVEVGMDTNTRKNRGGDEMEDLVEYYIQKAGFIKGSTYFKEMMSFDMERVCRMDLSPVTNNGETAKRFDFVIKTSSMVYAVETNFYTSNGSKLNETARSYKTLAIESRKIKDFTFMWITDGLGWKHARNNLLETFVELPTLYNIKEMEEGLFDALPK